MILLRIIYDASGIHWAQILWVFCACINSWGFNELLYIVFNLIRLFLVLNLDWTYFFASVSQIRKKIDWYILCFFVPGRFKKGCTNSWGLNEILYIVLNLDWTYFFAYASQIKKNRLIYLVSREPNCRYKKFTNSNRWIV